MKSKIICLLFCVFIAAAAMTGCGTISDIRSSDSTNESSDVSETTQDEDVDVNTSGSETETTEDAATDGESESEKKTEAVTVTEEFSHGVYNNGQVTVKLPDGWTYDESMGEPMFFSSAEPINGIQTNLNVVVSNEQPELMELTEDEYRESIEMIWGTGVTINAFEQKEIAGHNVLYTEYSISFNEITQLITQIIYNEDGKNLAYTYISGNTEQPAECLEIFESISLL